MSSAIQGKTNFAARMEAIGLAASDLAKLSGISKSQASEIANGRKPHASGTELVDRWLAKCEELAAKARPLPIDWRSTETVRDVMTLIRTDQLKIEIEPSGEKKSMEAKIYPTLPGDITARSILRAGPTQFAELENQFGLDQLCERFEAYLKEVDERVAARNAHQ
jgi:transcriptional regulator with XRE-family HTH domain